MQALLFAKRKMDIVSSRNWYQRGLRELECKKTGDDGDSDLEEAWIFNGLALNALLEARLTGKSLGSAFQPTYALLRRAFELVKEGRSPDRLYLRYNLLSNMSSFMELEGQHEVALRLIDSAFTPDLSEGLPDEDEWRALIGTRRAGLYAKAGDFANAERFYREAVELLTAADRPICAETVRRSLGTVVLAAGRSGDAESEFRLGLSDALAARSARGSRAHGAGLVTALAAQGRQREALDVIHELGETESLWLADLKRFPGAIPQSISASLRLYGLSTGIPEVELEENSGLSVANVLQGTKKSMTLPAEVTV